MPERRTKYRGAVGLSFYGYAPCCGAKLFGRSVEVLEEKVNEHRARCAKAGASGRPVQQQLFSEAPRG